MSNIERAQDLLESLGCALFDLALEDGADVGEATVLLHRLEDEISSMGGRRA